MIGFELGEIALSGIDFTVLFVMTIGIENGFRHGWDDLFLVGVQMGFAVFLFFSQALFAVDFFRSVVINAVDTAQVLPRHELKIVQVFTAA